MLTRQTGLLLDVLSQLSAVGPCFKFVFSVVVRQIGQ